jgi:CheY-like chemotaxis protein
VGSDRIDHAPPVAQRILVVDNEESVRDLLTEVLTEDGHRVVMAASASEALDKFQPGAFDLVLADLTLPGMDGLELSRHLRRVDTRAALAVFSGWSSRFLQAARQEECVDLTATKPLDVKQLRQLVAAAASLVARRQDRADASRG